MILVDSSVWIDFFNGVETTQVARLEAILGQEYIVTGDIILTEVLQGFNKDKDFEKAKSLFEHLECYDMLGKELAIKSATNFRYLRKKGVTIRKTIDVIIGTFCIEKGFSLLHSDKDFNPMEEYLGLRVY